MPPGFDRLKVLVMMNSLQISGAQGLLMLMGSKFLIKMTRPQNTDVDGIKIFDKDDQAAKQWGLEHLK